MKSTIKVTYRDIAKMLASALPVEGADFGDKVEDYLNTIKALPQTAKIALRSAYIFSRKVPREEREDLFQELCLAVLKAKAKDECLAYAIARCDWQDWWGKFKTRQHYSLDNPIDDGQGNLVTYAETLVGVCDFEARANGDLDGEALYAKLPVWVKSLVNKRLSGKPIRGYDRVNLNLWVAGKPECLAEYQNLHYVK